MPTMLDGSPRRDVLRALGAAILLGALFSAYVWLAKGVPAVYLHEPWQDDPYDVLVSFALLIGPLLVGLCLVRHPRWWGPGPVPTRRAADLLRAGRLLVGLVAATVAAEWLSVVLGSHRRAWTAATGGVLVALALVTVAAAAAGVLLRRAGRSVPDGDLLPQPDWLADLVDVAGLLAVRLGPLAQPGHRLVGWLDAEVVGRVRRNPLLAAGLAAVLLGAATESAQVLLEGYVLGFAAYVVGVSACTLFAVFVLGGRYLRVVEPRTKPGPAATVLVAVCAAVPLTVAFRNSLWWLAGTDERHGGFGALLALTGIVVAGTAAVTCAAALLRRPNHPGPVSS